MKIAIQPPRSHFDHIFFNNRNTSGGNLLKKITYLALSILSYGFLPPGVNLLAGSIFALLFLFSSDNSSQHRTARRVHSTSWFPAFWSRPTPRRQVRVVNTPQAGVRHTADSKPGFFGSFRHQPNRHTTVGGGTRHPVGGHGSVGHRHHIGS